MSTIINSAWKSKKEGDEVVYNGETYTIGSDAFASVNDAAAVGETSDLVIIDKKLTSPVSIQGGKEYISSASTEIFASTVKETESADGKTTTKDIKFAAAAGGTATVKDAGSELKGFEKVTANTKNGDSFSFQGGKQNISSSVKEVNDSDKSIQTVDKTASIESSATGSLSVTGSNGNIASVSLGAITDSEGRTDDSLSIIKETFKEATGNDYEDKTGASYASITLKLAEIDSSVNGGQYTEKSTYKTSNTNDEKKTAEYAYSISAKVGSGSATLTDTSVNGGIAGFKTVKISTSADAASTGGISSGDDTADVSTKSAYTADTSSTFDFSSKETTVVAGALTIAGKNTKEVTVDGEINDFSTMNLKFANVTGGIEAETESEKETISIAVKAQKDDAALTASFSFEETDKADGSLTAANSVIENGIEGVKTVTIQNSEVQGAVVATNSTKKATKKVTGNAVAGITEDTSAYVSKFDVVYTDDTTWNVLNPELVEESSAYTLETTRKVENSAGGTSFKLSGKVSDDSVLTNINGYKTVSLDNTDLVKTLTATTIDNNSKTSDDSFNVSYTPESAYTESWTETESDKAFGDATIKGRTTAGLVSGFASVKASGTADKTFLGNVFGQNTESKKETDSFSVKAGKDNAIGNYTWSKTESSKGESKLDASKVTLSGLGGYTDLKTVKLQGVVGVGDFEGAVDSESKNSKKVDWNADEISAEEKTWFYGDGTPGSEAQITDGKITAWTESEDSKSSAAGTFSLKNSAEIVVVSADNFKSVDVSGTNVTLSGVDGKGTENHKSDKSLTVTATKGTYSKSSTDEVQAATTLTVSKANVAAGADPVLFKDLKTVKLSDVKNAGLTVFNATVDEDSKYSKKFEWNAEEASYADIVDNALGINDPAITSWNESSESKKSAAGTFTVKNSATTVATFSASGFKSVDVSGALTSLSGVTGQDTESVKDEKSLSVNATKGTYSYSRTSNSKAASTLTVSSKAQLSGTFKNLKTVSLKDVTIAGNSTFKASFDEDSKSSEKIEWNAENAAFADLTGPYDENITSYTSTSENKTSVVGTFTLNKATFANPAFTLSIENFKNVEISGVTDVTADSLVNNGDSSNKYSLKRTVSETKRTQEISESSTETSVGSLKLSGTSALPSTLTMDSGSIGYSTILLKDAKIVATGAATADSYAETSSYTAKESATLDAGSVIAVDLKVSKTYSSKGNGSFSADGNAAFNAFENGTLNGYSTITLKNKISIGNVNNYKYDGDSTDFYAVPWDGEYFDVIAGNEDPSRLPGDEEWLAGNISGSYSMDQNGQINSKWTGSYATTAAGSFSQSATVINVTAGNITGYDKVTLSGVKTVGMINGMNTEDSTVLTYKTSKDGDVLADSKVVTITDSSASSVKLSGKKISGVLQHATALGIDGYKTVQLEDAIIVGGVSAVDYQTVTTTDKVDDVVITIEETSKAIGTLTATGESGIGAYANGFQTVKLTDTDAALASFDGGNEASTTVNAEFTFEEQAAAGSLTAIAAKKQGELGDPKLVVAQAVGNVEGFQKVALTDYSAGDVSVAFIGNTFGGKVAATYEKVIAEDEEKETPKTWQKAASTKGNSFSATVGSYYDTDAAAIKKNAITVGDVTGYGKVEATGLVSIGEIENAFVTDSVGFAGRKYSAKHYGNWTATAKEEEGKYTAISADASGSVKVKGLVQKDNTGAVIAQAKTDVKGNITGYSTVSLDYVTIGDATAADPQSIVYAGGKYSYTTKTNSDDDVIATSKSEAAGKLSISNADFVAIAGSTVAVEGFKTVAIDINAAVSFTSIISGNETAQFTSDSLDYFTYSFSGENKLALTTVEGEVTGKVSGFMEMSFTDTNIYSTAQIQGYQIEAKKVEGEWTQTQVARAAVTFEDADEGGTANAVAGKIIDAKTVVFKASYADAASDFAITGEIRSWENDFTATMPVEKSDMTITFDKSQATADLSKFFLDDGDVINLISGTTPETTAALTLGGDLADLDAYFANMAGASFDGTGFIYSTLEVADVETAMNNANITFKDTAAITIVKL